MDAKFSPRLNDVLSYSREEALRLGHVAIGTEHLLLGIIREGEGSAALILKALNVDLKALRKVIEVAIKNNERSDFTNSDHIELKKQAARAVKLTYLELKIFKSREIKTAHLLLSMLKDSDSVVTLSLKQFDVDYETVKNEFSLMLSNLKDQNVENQPKSSFDNPNKEEDDDAYFSSKKPQKTTSKKSNTLLF